MNLSIFNFNKIIKTSIACFLLFLVYNTFLILKQPKINMLQNQWQQNYSFAQDFIYEKRKADNIIVGSSMAARINNDWLPHNFYNLSFGGGSVLTGLEIIKKSGFIPKNLYIENNIIFREKDTTMIDGLFYPVLWQVKRYIPALKEKYQPLNLVISKLKGGYGKNHAEQMNEKRDEKIFNMTFSRQQENYNRSLKNYNDELNDLKRLIFYFEKQGVNIVFFETPIDDRLAKSTSSIEQRTIIKDNFKNKWLNLPTNDNYSTADGIHMIYKSAYEYTHEFLMQTNSAQL